MTINHWNLGVEICRRWSLNMGDEHLVSSWWVDGRRLSGALIRITRLERDHTGQREREREHG